MNRLVSRTDPLGRTETFTYDFNGNLTTVTDRKGQVTTHTYDAQNRRIRSDYADGSSVTYAYDPTGQLLTATDSQTGTITRSYDALDRLVGEGTPQGAITYSYDPASRRQNMQINGLAPVAYAYDAASRLTGITQATQAATLTYDAANRRSTLTLPNGVTTSYSYDAASRLIAQTYTGPGGPLGSLTYAYDANGNRLATGGSFARTLIPSAIPTTSYDQANQQLAFGPTTQTFDTNGNLLTQTDASGTTTYTWDTRNRLAGINGPTVTAAFTYDALGRRISRTVNGDSSTFQYDRLDIVREVGSAGDTAYLRTLRVDEVLARTDATGIVTYLADALGSTVALVDPSGTAPTEYTYSPFGTTQVSGQPTTNPFQFTGRENDPARLYYYRARYYDPGRGRFLEEDSRGRARGLNLYAYVANNPINFTDPSGLFRASKEDCEQIKREIGFIEDLLKSPSCQALDRVDLLKQLNRLRQEYEYLGCDDNGGDGGRPSPAPVPSPDRIKEKERDLVTAGTGISIALVTILVITRLIRLAPPLLPLQLSPF